MRAWWSARTRREQILLAVLAAALSVFILWFGLWRPLSLAHRAAEARFEQAAADHLVVSRTVARIRRLQSAAPQAGRSTPPAEAVNAAAAAAGLTLARVEPDPAGGVQVAVGGVSPAKLFPWLADLQQTHGVAPRHMTIVKEEGGALALDATFGGA